MCLNLKLYKHSLLRAAYPDRTFKRLGDIVVSPILSPRLNTSCAGRHFVDMWQSWVGLKILRSIEGKTTISCFPCTVERSFCLFHCLTSS